MTKSTFLLILLLHIPAVVSFVGVQRAVQLVRNVTPLRAEMTPTSSVEEFLEEEHFQFYSIIMSKNPEVWKKLRESDSSTIFAVTDAGMMELGEKKLSQLADIRNEESVMKMGEYHAINEAVTEEQLYDSSGVIPIGGDAIPVERGVSGGFFGVGGKEDGSIRIGGAKILDSLLLDNRHIIHRVDTLVSPSILWRYFDQLRIPGSQ